jgi:hypothetical protein
MTKTQAISIFGNRQQDLADAVGVTRSAVAQWPEELPPRQIDIVVGAAVRLGKWPSAGHSESSPNAAEAA